MINKIKIIYFEGCPNFGSTADLSDQQIEDMAQAFLDANYPPEETGATSNVSVSSDSTTVTIDISGYVETSFLKVAGIRDRT